MQKVTKWAILVVTILIGAQLTYAGGFQVNEHSARATGMGGAVYASLYDASAIYYNPGALSFVPGTSIVLGSTFIMPSSKVNAPLGHAINIETEMESKIHFPSAFYVSHSHDSGFGYGLGVFNPFGLGTEWPENWVGRYLGVESSLRTYYINPTISYREGERFGIGFGFNYVYGSVELKQALLLDPNLPDGRAEMDGTGTGMGWNLGIYFMPDPWITIGIAYRSHVTVDFDGDAVISVPSPLDQMFPGGSVGTSVHLPATLHSGISYTGIDNWSLNFGLQWTFWRELDEIVIDFATKTALQDEQILPLNYDDGYILRFGLEYTGMSALDLRAGYLFDSNPTPDEWLTPRLPDADRHGISLGGGYRISDNVALDLAYMLLLFTEREVTDSKLGVFGGETVEDVNPPFNARYNSFANLVGINLRFSF